MRVRSCLMLLVVAAFAGVSVGQTVSLPAPHPMISEVLSAVPSGPRGDANGDGVRDAVGDEFVELVNPHDKPIQLKGYMLVDADAWAPGAARPGSGGRPSALKPAPPASDKPGTPGGASPATDPGTDSSRAELRFVFPELELKPGQVVVVFNGYHQKTAGPVGDSSRSAGPNEKFHDAFVFTMKNESPYAAFSNEADFVLLVAPDGTAVHCVKWGKASKNPPKDTLLVEEAPPSIGSVQREGVHGKLMAHKDLKGDLAGTFCSPGVFSLTPGIDPPSGPNHRPPSKQQPRPSGGKP